jgi:hypothetical protein
MMTKQEAKAQVRKAKAALETAKWNLYFAGLTKAEKRVAIAKDVLAQLKLGTIKSTPGTYTSITRTDDDGQIQKCEACALGALFACATVREVVEDGRDTMENESSWEMREKLAPYFSADQLGAIENAYERGAIVYAEEIFGLDNQTTAFVESDAVLNFNKGIRNKRERMERIMKNIIRNNGTFIP